ncbi:MAG: glycosyltransferase [Acidimicrobiia bacterium]|nr:glycosyltransferase [Acidimicrobiia bacterium]
MPSPSQHRATPVAIVYHFFQHYREGILNALASSESLDVRFVADDHDVYGSGVEAWHPGPGVDFELTRCRVLGGHWLWQSGLQRLALRSDVEAIVYLGNPYFLSTWLSALLARVRGKRVLFWTHGWLRPETGFKGLVRKTFYRLANALLVYGETARQMAVDNGFSPDQVYVVFNSLDYAAQKQAREAQAGSDLDGLRSDLFDTPELPIVICSSRLLERRRLDLLIDAAARLRDQGHPVNLLIVGDGPEKTKLEALSDSQGVSARFHGATYDLNELARLYAISAVTVSPGMVGLTAIQSLGFGVPVISHDSPADQMPESEAIIPGQTGALFTHGDVSDLAATIQEWTADIAVPDETRRACIELVENVFNPRNQLSIIEGAVAGRRPTESAG